MSDPINSIKVDGWKTGDRNDCWWNIARNQAGKDASIDEVRQMMEKIIAYNNEKTGKEMTPEDTLMPGDNILIPIENAVDDVRKNIVGLSEQYEQLKASYKEQTGILEKANSNVNNALNELAEKEEILSKIDQKANPAQYMQAKGAFETAKIKYQKALKEQKEAQNKMDEIKSNIDKNTNQTLSAQEQLDELIDELKQSEEANSELITHFSSERDSLNFRYELSEEEMQAQSKADANATSMQEVGKRLGAIGENGELSENWEVNNYKLICEADKNRYGSELSSKVDGNKRIATYADGTKVTYEYDIDTNSWKRGEIVKPEQQ